MAGLFQENAEIQEAFRHLRATTPERFHPLVDRIVQGSRAAAAKLHCLECCAWETKEVKLCTCTQCALWAFRPYQTVAENGEEDAADDAAAAIDDAEAA